jgi:hypothetical protein
MTKTENFRPRIPSPARQEELELNKDETLFPKKSEGEKLRG